jgi:hypothetical protein
MEIKQPTDEKKERDASFFWFDVVKAGKNSSMSIRLP